MVDTVRSLSDLQTLLADNNTHAISPQDLRDFLVTAVPSGRAPSKVVAASDAPNARKYQADYVCDGTADQTEINSAIDDLSAAGGAVQLTEGTFTLSGRISIDQSAITLCGSGMTATTLTLANSANDNVIRVGASATLTGVTIEDLYIDGNAAGQTKGTVLEERSAIWVDTTNGAIQELELARLYVTDAMGMGISADGNATYKIVRPVYRDLVLTGNGSQSGAGGWAGDGLHMGYNLDANIYGGWYGLNSDTGIAMDYCENCRVWGATGYGNTSQQFTCARQSTKIWHIGCVADGNSVSGAKGFATGKFGAECNASSNWWVLAPSIRNTNGAAGLHIEDHTLSYVYFSEWKNCGTNIEYAGTVLYPLYRGGVDADGGGGSVKSEAGGVGSIVNPATTATISHGLLATPNAAGIHVTPTTNGAGVNRWWVSNVGTADFTVNVDTLSSGSMQFSWAARLDV